MNDIVAVVGEDELVTQSVLAAEALRKAASRRGRSIAIEVRLDQGVLDALDMKAESDAASVLLVGNAELDAGRFHGLKQTRASLNEALADADAVLARAVEAASAG